MIISPSGFDAGAAIGPPELQLALLNGADAPEGARRPVGITHPLSAATLRLKFAPSSRASAPPNSARVERGADERRGETGDFEVGLHSRDRVAHDGEHGRRRSTCSSTSATETSDASMRRCGDRADVAQHAQSSQLSRRSFADHGWDPHTVLNGPGTRRRRRSPATVLAASSVSGGVSNPPSPGRLAMADEQHAVARRPSSG